jgi:small-conductance mechanosensitive channel
LKTFSTFIEAQSFVDDLLAVGAYVEIQFDYAVFKEEMTKVQLGIGIAMLFISFVTKSILLCISSIVFIIFIKASNV